MTKPTHSEESLREAVEAVVVEIIQLPAGKTIIPSYYTDELMRLFEAERNTAVVNTEKAYGGCRSCYGKGYATVNGRWRGYDTDQDIGSPGGYVSGGNPNVMKFCTCSRGRQLKQLTSGDKEG